jgi:hypothetical protein
MIVISGHRRFLILFFIGARTVTGLPTNGSTIYVRLRYVLGGSWQNTIYHYTAATP